MMKQLNLHETDFEKRLDYIIMERFPDISRNKIQSHIKTGNILVNNKIVKTGYLLKKHDVVTTIDLEIKPIIKTDLEAINLNLDIVYEDDDVAVVNKPKDLVVHPASTFHGVTLVNGLLFQINKLSTINGKNRPGIIHRLDKNTSGLLIIAKSDEAHIALAKDISKHKVLRKYYAIVYGTFENATGTVDMPIKRDPNSRLKMATIEGGRKAVTHFKVIEEYVNHSLLDVELETGRTHQIRVHMAKINHPILGDDVYGPKKTYGKDGQYLHAYQISFFHPIKKVEMTFTTPLPNYFSETIKSLV